jgi:hypothetical protein
MAYLLVPLAGLALALLWAGWSVRPRRRAGTVQTIAAYHRALAAIARTRDGSPPPGRPG